VVPGQLQLPSAGGSAARSNAFLSFRLGTVDERMLILVDIERLMSGSDMALMNQAFH
jgi:purine-binding chemotaxis protein CheW